MVDDLRSLALVVARRRCIDALRRSYVTRRVLVDGPLVTDEPAAAAPSPEANLERSEVRSILMRVREKPAIRRAVQPAQGRSNLL